MILGGSAVWLVAADELENVSRHLRELVTKVWRRHLDTHNVRPGTCPGKRKLITDGFQPQDLCATHGHLFLMSEAG